MARASNICNIFTDREPVADFKRVLRQLKTYIFTGQKIVSKKDLKLSKSTAKMKYNYSGISLEEISNSYNTTTEFTSVEEAFKWTNDEIARLIQIIFRPILVIVGRVGNSLIIYIMRRSSLRHLSTCFYMFLLAVADSSK